MNTLEIAALSLLLPKGRYDTVESRKMRLLQRI